MTETWPDIVSADLAAQPLGTVLMLGSGGEALLGQLPQGAATRVIRAEPDPLRVRSLQRRYALDSSVTILSVAVAEASGPAKLRRFNLSQATSLRAPTGLKTLFPGLCETGQAEVETQTAGAVLQEVDLDREADHVLILGLAGEELAIIRQLSDLDLLQSFAHVIVPLPGLPLYEGAGEGREIRARLEEAGFRIESRDMSDPDFSFAHLRLDRAHVALAAERARLQVAKETANAEIERLKSLRAQIASARDAAQAELAEAEEKVEAQAGEIARLQEVVAGAKAERARLQEAQETATAEIERLKSERAQSASARDAAQAGLAEAEEKVEAQAGEVARLQETVSEAKQKHEAAQKSECAAQEEKERIRILSDTCRHAIRLELLRASGGTSDRARPPSPAVLRWLEALDGPTSAVTSHCLSAPIFNLDVYRKATEDAAEHADRHVVLDVKSIPRSGLHYMKRQFAHLFQDRFSFCEWYQEPGCCKRMPCAFFPHAEGDGAALRMLKSHDFDLTDPVYPVTPGLQRLILVRNPLYVLTSHWLLHLLAKNKEILTANDIRFEKIVYLHEPAVLSRAYALLDEEGVIPDTEAIAAFLSEQQDYLTGFARKWAAAAEMPRTYVVPYHKTPLAIKSCLMPIREAMSADQRARLDDYAAGWRKSFRPRQDPFRGPTPYLSSLLERHAALFRSAANAIHDADSSGIFDLSG